MFEKRTDLAIEVQEMRGNDSGIIINEETRRGFAVTRATVSGESGVKNSGKPEGEYITLDVGSEWRRDRARFAELAEILSQEISALLPKGEGCVLVAGLGNERITPDALGPKTIKQLIVTRHIEDADPTLFYNGGFGSVSAIASGVLAQTGIETAELIKGVCDTVHPKCVIVIDALASRRLSRLCTTVQLSSAGIAPGSGVANRRTAINKELLGVPVVSVGVPTVVDAATLAMDILEEQATLAPDAARDAAEALMSCKEKNSFVAPKDSDVITDSLSRLLALSLNMALHRMTADECLDFLF